MTLDLVILVTVLGILLLLLLLILMVRNVQLDVALIKHYEDPDTLVQDAIARTSSAHLEAAAQAEVLLLDALLDVATCRTRSVDARHQELTNMLRDRRKLAILFVHRR